jgi:hypothetical protein
VQETVKEAVGVEASFSIPAKKGGYTAQTISHSTKEVTVTTKL